MNTFRCVIATMLLAMASSVANAQCTGSTIVADACTKVTDLLNYATPQFSTALAGGSATMGQGGTLAGLGHVAVSVRATAVVGAMPKFNGTAFNTGGAVPTSFSSENVPVPMLTADAAIGIYRGISLGVTHVGGVDALVSATYLPNVNGGDMKMTVAGSNMKFGYGVRVGILEESLLAPGVAISFIQRDLPTFSISGASNVAAAGANAPGTFALNDFTLQTSAIRLTASKSFLIFALNAGVGQDTYKGSSNLRVTVTPAVGGAQAGAGSTSMSMTRTNMFVGTQLNLFLFKIVGELGQVTGGSTPALKNNFGAAADKSRNYASVGVRFAL